MTPHKPSRPEKPKQADSKELPFLPSARSQDRFHHRVPLVFEFRLHSILEAALPHHWLAADRHFPCRRRQSSRQIADLESRAESQPALEAGFPPSPAPAATQ